MNSLLLLLFFFISFPLRAENRIILLRGEAYTKTSFSDRKKIVLKKNDLIPNNSLIWTLKKSVLKISVPNKGVLTFGPNTHAELVEFDNLNSTSVVNLFNGQLRATFPPKENDKVKLYLRTKTASLGIRGTEFLITYNPLNGITSTIGLKGHVYLKKSRLDATQEDIDDFQVEETTIIPEKHFSGAYPGFEYETTPTKISPKQFRALLQNKDLKQKQNASPGSANLSQEQYQNDYLIPSPQDLSLNSTTSLSEKITPKAGGYIDLNTGIYISPPEDSLFDSKEQVYIPPKDYGSVDEQTGEYLPPFGLILDPIKGFTVAVASGLKHGADFIGENINKGVEGLRGQIDQTGKVLTEAKNEASKRLEKLADKLNQHVYKNFLYKIHQFIKSNKYLSALRANTEFKTFYDSNILKKNMQEFVSQTKAPSLASDLEFTLSYLVPMESKVIFEPFFFFYNKYHYRDQIDIIRENDQQTFSGGLKTSYDTTLGNRSFISELVINYQKEFRKTQDQYHYKNYLKDWNIEFTQQYAWNYHWLLNFSIAYDNYKLRYEDKGDRYTFKFSPLYNLSSQDFLKLELLHRTRKRDVNQDDFKTNLVNLSYYRKHMLKNWDFSFSVAHLRFTPGKLKHLRGDEKENSLEVKLKRVLWNHIHAQIFYQIFDRSSEQKILYDYTKFELGLGLNVYY